MKKGLVQVYTGNGKGKTTCAFGLALRASGYDLKILIIQFFKPTDYYSGEVIAATNSKNITVKRFGNSKVWGLLKPKKLSAIDDQRSAKEECQKALVYLSKNISDDFDIVILDEIASAINNGFISIEEVVDLIKSKPATTEIVLTGRNMPQQIIDVADLVSEIKEVKHPFKQGISARKGIEF